MGDVATIKNTETEAAAAEETKSDPKEAIGLGTERMSEVTNWLLEQIRDGEICRFGPGWIFLCPKCDTMIFTDEQFKTFSAPDRNFYRIAPSVKCPNESCDWHKMIVIDPEVEVDIKTEQGTEKAGDNTQPVAEV